ncbi:MAG: hypothetical protein VX252_05945 [Myxococcota bacterium]|nr:hypothetical protein [Myxococcota bacterium]
MSANFQSRSSLSWAQSLRSSHVCCAVVGLLLALFTLACGDGPARVVILSPANGTFTTASTVEVTGVLIDVNLEAVDDVQVNGISVGDLNDQPAFTITVPLSSGSIEQPIVAEVIGKSGTLLRDRVTLIMGDSIADGDFSEQGIALRLNDSGLEEIEPLVASLVPLDVASLVPPGTVVEDNYCYSDTWFGCIGRIDAVVSGSPPPSISDFTIDVDSMTDFVAGDVLLQDLYFKMDVFAVTGIGFSCQIEVSASTADIVGNFELSPLASDVEKVDVSQLGNVGVSFSGFSDTTNCDGFLGFIVEFFVGLAVSDLQNNFVKPGLEEFLNTVDASGNTPIAGSIELALEAIEIAGPIGNALGVNLEAPFYDIYMDSEGITFDSDARVVSSEPDPDAVELDASYHVDQSFPTFGPLSPSGQPYELGISISASAFNQLLKAETEIGLLLRTIVEFDLGAGLAPITAGLLATVFPQFSFLDPNEPLQFEIRPNLAPIFSGDAGPSGQLATLLISHLEFSVVPVAEPSVVLLGGLVDVTLGVDVGYDAAGLSFQVETPDPSNVDVILIKNPLYVDTATLELFLPSLVGIAIPTIADSLGSFPLPEFLGLQLVLIEADRTGEYLSIFFDMSAAP